MKNITLGVTYKNGKLTAAVYGRGCSFCNILIREEGGEWVTHKLSSHALYPQIFTGEFPVDGKKRLEYIFESEKGFFLDDHALKVLDEYGYGKICPEPDTKSLKNRSILSDTLGKVCVVEKDVFDWKKDKRVTIPTSDMVAYELHVRGFTVHESSKVNHRGTYKGLCEKLMYLKNLGITTIILQPCYEFNELMDYSINIGSSPLIDMQRSRLFAKPAQAQFDVSSRLNFWGYGAQSVYFAPKSAYASKPENVCSEFKDMVRRIHLAGMELIMEIDYAHGISDSFILENIRFWVDEYHVDGFRLNVLRVPMKLLAEDPYLCNIKIIGSAFDESIFSEKDYRDRFYVTNDGFQDTLRRFLKGDEGQLLSACELMKDNGRRFGKINYMADHNGFTLNDVYSYDIRHNEKNGEGNRDGREVNFSWNCGAEGATKKRKILDLRNRMIKNALTVLFLSQGIPMLLAGDEFGNTHEGNNNPYCCDNEQGWVVWNRTGRANEIRKYTSDLIKLRKAHPVFRNDSFLSGNDFSFTGVPDISFHGVKAWYPDFGYYSRTVGVCLNGDYAAKTADGKDSSFLLLINTHWEEHEFQLPVIKRGEWEKILSTGSAPKSVESPSHEQREVVPARTICLYISKERKKNRPEVKNDSK